MKAAWVGSQEPGVQSVSCGCCLWTSDLGGDFCVGRTSVCMGIRRDTSVTWGLGTQRELWLDQDLKLIKSLYFTGPRFPLNQTSAKCQQWADRQVNRGQLCVGGSVVTTLAAQTPVGIVGERGRRVKRCHASRPAPPPGSPLKKAVLGEMTASPKENEDRLWLHNNNVYF